MDCRLLRSLVFYCGLLLALPPGWCCAPAPAAAAEAPPAPRESSCCCCRHPAPPDDKPAPAVPPSPGVRCCCEKESTKPPAASVFDLDPAGFLVPAADAVGAPVLLRTPADLVGPRVHAPPLRLLHCVWLC